MYIHQIDIDNFKSFAEKTSIPFRKGFTTISGPNGSGKSNIIDSILFCLGLSTSRTMRAEKLSDLINNLSRRKECVVTITFRKELHEQETDRASQLEIPAEGITTTGKVSPKGHLKETGQTEEEGPGPESPKEEVAPDELITVARRIKGTPSGYTSTYYLNGQTTTLTEIHETLGRFNISPGCFNVMMQGDVAGFVNMSPVERRKIIDEIAGVAEFDRKIEQAQRELEATGDNIERNTILLNEIELRLEQLATERETALKYQKLRDEKHEWENQLLAAKYVDLKKALQAANQNIAEARNKKAQTEDELRQLVEEIAKTREELLRLSEEVKKKGEDQQIALKKQIEGLKGHIARKEDSIKFIETQAAENLKSVEKMKEEILRQKENIETLDSEIEGFNHQLKEVQALYNKESRAYEKLNKQFDAITESSGELSVKRSEIRQKLTAAEDELSGLHRDKLDLEAGQKRLEYDKQLRLQGQSDYAEKEQALSERFTTLEKQVRDLELEKSAYEAQLKKTQLDYSKLRVDLNTATGKVNELNRVTMRLEAQKRAYDDLNFARPVEMALNSGISGIHGTLAQLGNVDTDYAVAMEVAIGGRIQSVVVDDDQVAADCIEHLKRNKGGRATFLPLNKIQRSRGLPALPRGSGIVDFAINLIDFDPIYTDVFAYALGETLIVEDMDAARQYLRKYRMVTLDGALLERSGAMSGGSAPGGSRAGSRFANSGKIEQEIEALMKRLEKAELSKDQLEKQLANLESKLDGLKGEYAQCANLHTRATTEFESVSQQLEELKAKTRQSVDVSDLDRELGELAQKLAAMDGEFGKREKAVQSLRDELDAVESKLPADKINAIREEMNDVKFQMDYYDSQIRNIQADIQGKTMEKNYQEVGIQEYEGRIHKTLEHNKAMEKEKVEHFEEIKLTVAQITELEAQTTELDEELKKLQDERDGVQGRLIEEEKNKNILERQITQLDEQITAFQNRKHELEPQVREVRQELAAQNLDPDAIKAEELPSGEEVQKNIVRLTKRMEAMEPVNMLAIQEYDDVNGRKTELSEKIDTLNSEKDALHLKISSYEELKLSSFRQAFDHVDENFKRIFEELADGSGRLVLSNPDQPFNGGMTIEAQPRGKKMQRIEAMSGGEKSLTSLAFVFSLQRYLPAPFYALDEVDMNLDGINAEKLANMVKRESQKGAQFIVVSLRKPMIEHSNRTVGVTQKKGGITKVTGVKIREYKPNQPGDASLPEELSEAEILGKSPAKAGKKKVKHERAVS